MIVVLLLTMFFFSLGQFGRIEFGYGIVLHANEVFLSSLCISWLAIQKKKALNYVIRSPLIKPITLLTMVMVVSLLVNFHRYSVLQLLSSFLYTLRFVLYFTVYLVFGFYINTQTKNFFHRIFNLTGFVVAMVGLILLWLVPNTSFLAVEQWDDHYYRLISTYLDPGFTSILLLLAIFTQWSSLSNWQSKIILSITYIAFALTYSRAGYLSFLAGFSYLAYYYKSRSLFFKALVLLLMTVVFVPRTFGEGTHLERKISTWARFSNWKESINIWLENPLFGIGFNAYRFKNNIEINNNPEKLYSSHGRSGADSTFLFVLATMGIIGGLAYSNSIYRIWQLADKSAIFRAGLIAIAINSWFNNTAFYPFVMEWVWLMLALAI